MAPVFKLDDYPPPIEGKLKPFGDEEWSRLTPKQQWDTIVSLRGPDLRGSESVKWYTTSIIRGKMRKILRVGGLVNTDLNLILLPANGEFGIKPRPSKPYTKKPSGEVGKYAFHYAQPVETHIDHEKCDFCLYEEKQRAFLESIPRFDYSHFFQHIAEAGAILSIPIAFIEGDVWVDAMLQHSYTRAGMMVLEWMEKVSDHPSPSGERQFPASSIKELKRHLRREGE